MLGQIYREEYLTYKQQIIDREQETESIDLEIAKTILLEYLPKFRTVAIAKIERILRESDRSLELQSNNNSIESYLKSIIKSLEAIETE